MDVKVYFELKKEAEENSPPRIICGLQFRSAAFQSLWCWPVT